MKERLIKKIDEVIEHIISKPAAKITANDFAILSGKLNDIRMSETSEERNKNMAEMFSRVFSSSTI